MNKYLKYSKLPTEQNNPRTLDLDRIPLRKVLLKLNYEDALVAGAVRKVIGQIEKAAKIVSKVYLNGGKIFFIGAGTSGRLGVIESAELVPTFGIPRGKFIAIMAGGASAVFLSKEGAEDIFKDGEKEIIKKAKKGDVVIGIAASGITPYVRGALSAAHRKKAHTILITSNYKQKKAQVDVLIAVNLGPEPISGSTRMKSATATKFILNMLTTSAMILAGKVYKNWMVDLKPMSRKLILRSERIVSIIAGISHKKAKELLKKTNYNVKAAIVMAKLNVDFKKAKKLLKKSHGFLKDVIE